MTTPGSKNSTLSVSATSNLDTRSGYRIVVLMPYLEADPSPLAHKVWELANATGAYVQIISLYSDAAQEFALRRQLIHMSALVKDEMIPVETEVIHGKDWVGALMSRWKPGDIIVCLAEQRVGFLGKPLNELLQSDPSLSLHILTGLYHQKDFRSSWSALVAAWTGFIAIVSTFFLLQVKIGDLLGEGNQIPWLVLSVVVEFWLIWGWHQLFG